MELRKANRNNTYIRIGISGPAGSGKSYSSLLLAKGMLGSLQKVAIIDSEKGSGHLYSHLGNYSIISLDPPYFPDAYIKALELAENSGIEVCIIDSLSHAWEATIDKHASLSGNSFKNWGFVKSKFKQLIDRILSSQMHVIATFRTKSDYVINTDSKGHMKPEKVGLKSITSDESDYEFTILFDLNLSHVATCTKDRTQLFNDYGPTILNEDTGSVIATWCMNTSVNDVKAKLVKTENLDALKGLYDRYIAQYPELQNAFTHQKQIIKSNSFSPNNGFLS